MKRTDLLNQWILQVLRYVKSKHGYQNQMCLNGHLRHHHFSTDTPVYNISLSVAIRLIVNYAQVCKNTEKEHEFKDDWNRLGDAIMLLVDNGIVDILNKMFNPKND
jgi:hypothetical protein